MQRLREATALYLQNEPERVLQLLRENLRDDPKDVESLFRIAVVCREQGDLRSARRCLARLRRVDVEQKWGWEAEEEAALLRKAASHAVPGGRR